MKTRHVTLQQMYDQWLGNTKNAKAGGLVYEAIAEKYNVNPNDLVCWFRFFVDTEDHPEIHYIIRTWH